MGLLTPTPLSFQLLLFAELGFLRSVLSPYAFVQLFLFITRRYLAASSQIMQ